jgi:hypothetical protein
MCSGELVTAMSSNTENPHLDATDHTTRLISLQVHQWYSTHTEDLVADIVLPDEVAQKLLVDTGLVDNLRGQSVDFDPNDNMQLHLTAVSQKVHPSSNALSNTGSACSNVRL